MLILCATPIGNLEDISFRAIRTLKECDYIYAEDTRVTLKLLSYYEIQKPLRTYHEHSSDRVVDEILELSREHDVVLVTDAGMPGISDPGLVVIRGAIDRGIDFTLIPGASAFTLGLVGSGFENRTFFYGGFLPKTKKNATEMLSKFKDFEHTIVLYESPHHIVSTLSNIVEILGDRQIVIARELTKIYEEFLRGSANDLISYFAETKPRGEMVVVIEPHINQKSHFTAEEIVELLKSEIKNGVTKKEAITKVAKQTSTKKNEVYKLAESMEI